MYNWFFFFGVVALFADHFFLHCGQSRCAIFGAPQFLQTKSVVFLSAK
jgi:hypothetical protein